MTGAEYLARLQRSLASSFDFRPLATLPIKADLYASLNVTNESYFISRKIPLYAVKNNEYIIGRIIKEPLRAEQAAELTAAVKQEVSSIVKVDSDHMSSVVTLAVFCEQGLDDAARQHLQRFKYHKDFMFTLRGWADIAVIAVDLAAGTVESNKFGRRLRENYQKIFANDLTDK